MSAVERILREQDARIADLEGRLAVAREVIADAWNQFAYDDGKGGLHSGGLSTLEYLENWLAANPAKPPIQGEL